MAMGTKRGAVRAALQACVEVALHHGINDVYLFGSAVHSSAPRDIDLAIPNLHLLAHRWAIQLLFEAAVPFAIDLHVYTESSGHQRHGVWLVRQGQSNMANVPDQVSWQRFLHKALNTLRSIAIASADARATPPPPLTSSPTSATNSSVLAIFFCHLELHDNLERLLKLYLDFHGEDFDPSEHSQLLNLVGRRLGVCTHRVRAMLDQRDTAKYWRQHRFADLPGRPEPGREQVVHEETVGAYTRTLAETSPTMVDHIFELALKYGPLQQACLLGLTLALRG